LARARFLKERFVREWEGDNFFSHTRAAFLPFLYRWISCVLVRFFVHFRFVCCFVRRVSPGL
jgi:hypothetical protein